MSGIAKGSTAYKLVGSYVTTPLNWQVLCCAYGPTQLMYLCAASKMQGGDNWDELAIQGYLRSQGHDYRHLAIWQVRRKPAFL